MRALVAAFVFGSVSIFSAAAQADGCGRVPDGADWFFLAEPPPRYATAAGRVLKAIHEGLDPSVLPRDPSCVHVSILDDLSRRSADLSSHRQKGLPASAVGFHLDKLGADNTVYVMPSTMPLEIVMLHETLHSLSHRFTKEADRRRFTHLVEGITDYITRELAVLSLGYRRDKLHSGYDDYVVFVTALVKHLGTDGTLLLADSYFRDGYDTFERDVDRHLRVSLGAAARDLQADRLRAAVKDLTP